MSDAWRRCWTIWGRLGRKLSDVKRSRRICNLFKAIGTEKLDLPPALLFDLTDGDRRSRGLETLVARVRVNVGNKTRCSSFEGKNHSQPLSWARKESGIEISTKIVNGPCRGVAWARHRTRWIWTERMMECLLCHPATRKQNTLWAVMGAWSLEASFLKVIACSIWF